MEQKTNQVEPSSSRPQETEAEAFRKLYPREYYKRFIQKEIRPDGRNILQCRKTTLSSGGCAKLVYSDFTISI
jgi:hypothetical protein